MRLACTLHTYRQPLPAAEVAGCQRLPMQSAHMLSLHGQWSQSCAAMFTVAVRPCRPLNRPGSGRTCKAWRSARRLESEGRGFRPLPLHSSRAKWLKPYFSPSGLSLHCRVRTAVVVAHAGLGAALINLRSPKAMHAGYHPEQRPRGIRAQSWHQCGGRVAPRHSALCLCRSHLGTQASGHARREPVQTAGRA